MKQLFEKHKCYSLKWQIIFNTDYKVSECKKVINTKTGNIIKETIVGYTRGFWICKKFISKKKLNDYTAVSLGLTGNGTTDLEYDILDIIDYIDSFAVMLKIPRKY